MTTLTEEDEGKFVVDAEGEDVGIVTEVDEDAGVGYFEPDPSVSEAVLASFGHTDRGGDDLRLPEDAVETVTDDDVRLAGDV